MLLRWTFLLTVLCHACELPVPRHGLRRGLAVEQPLKIAILYLYELKAANKHWVSIKRLGWNSRLIEQLIKNREDYASLHGYDVINANDCINYSRPVAWSKLDALYKHLPNYDYIFFIDMDAVIMEPGIRLETLIDSAGHEKEFIFTEDWNGLNSGVFIVKNTPWSAFFLKLCSAQERLLINYDDEGYPFPFKYEQRAFHYLLNTETWTVATNLRYPHTNASLSETRSHIAYLPQCAMNSYSYLDAEYMEQYKDGDFIIHMAGKKSTDSIRKYGVTMLYKSLHIATVKFKQYRSSLIRLSMPGKQLRGS